MHIVVFRSYVFSAPFQSYQPLVEGMLVFYRVYKYMCNLQIQHLSQDWPAFFFRSFSSLWAIYMSGVSSVQLLSYVRLFSTQWTTARQASLSITNFWSPPKLMSIESVMPSNHFILCRPLLLPSSTFPSIRVFSNESGLCIRWPKYWSFSFNIILFTLFFLQSGSQADTSTLTDWLITPLPSFYESRTLLFDSLKQSLGQSKCSICSICGRYKQFPKNKILLYYWVGDIWHKLL